MDLKVDAFLEMQTIEARCRSEHDRIDASDLSNFAEFAAGRGHNPAEAEISGEKLRNWRRTPSCTTAQQTLA